jgi:hypothetical protein
MPSDDPGQRPEARRESVPAAPPANWHDAPASHQGNRRAPWYARPPEPERPADEYQTAEYQTAEYQTVEYQTAEFRPAREQRSEPRRRTEYREDDQYEEPARYDRYAERARGRGPDTDRQWR